MQTPIRKCAAPLYLNVDHAWAQLSWSGGWVPADGCHVMQAQASTPSTSEGQVPAWLSGLGLAALPVVAWSQYSLFQTGECSVATLCGHVAMPFELHHMIAVLPRQALNQAFELQDAGCRLALLAVLVQQRGWVTYQFWAWPAGACMPAQPLVVRPLLVRHAHLHITV